MQLEEQKRWTILVASRNFAVNYNNKANAFDQQAVCFHLSQYTENENKTLVRGDFG